MVVLCGHLNTNAIAYSIGPYPKAKRICTAKSLTFELCEEKLHGTIPRSLNRMVDSIMMYMCIDTVSVP